MEVKIVERSSNEVKWQITALNVPIEGLNDCSSATNVAQTDARFVPVVASEARPDFQNLYTSEAKTTRIELEDA